MLELCLFQFRITNRQNFKRRCKTRVPPLGSCRVIGRSAKPMVNVGFEFVIERNIHTTHYAGKIAHLQNNSTFILKVSSMCRYTGASATNSNSHWPNLLAKTGLFCLFDLTSKVTGWLGTLKGPSHLEKVIIFAVVVSRWIHLTADATDYESALHFSENRLVMEKGSFENLNNYWLLAEIPDVVRGISGKM